MQPVTFVGCVGRGSVKGDRVRVHLPAWLDRDGRARNRGAWLAHKVQHAVLVYVYTAWRICNLWQREVSVGLRMQPAYVTVEA